MNATINQPLPPSTPSQTEAGKDSFSEMPPALAADQNQLSALLEPLVTRILQQASEELGDLARLQGNTTKASLMLDSRRLLIERRVNLRTSFIRRFAERFTQAHLEQQNEARSKQHATLREHTPFGLARAEDHADLMLPKSMADAIRAQYHGFRFVGNQQVGIRPTTPPSWSNWPWLPEILSIALKDTLSENGFGLNMRLAMLPMINAHLPSAFKSAMEALAAQRLQQPAPEPESAAPATPAYIATPSTPTSTASPTNQLLHALELMQHALSVDAQNGVLYAAMSANGHNRVLRDMREKGTPGLDSQMNTRMLELMAMWFDLVLNVQDIPPAIKAQLGRLQIPYLRLALSDRSFFSSKTHPARQLIEHIATAARTEDALPNALIQKIEATTLRVLGEYRNNVELFAELDADFQRFLQESVPTSSSAQEAPTSAPEYSIEQLKAAKKWARAEVQLRHPEEALPEIIEALLKQQLPALLALVRLNNQSRPEAVDQMLGILDDLVESLTPSRWATERTAMFAVLPSLLARLDAAVKSGGIDARKRDNLFSNLAKCHAYAMKTSAETEPALPEMVFTESAADDPSPTAVADHFDRLVSRLEQGMKFSFLQSNGEQTACKLAWVSPKKGVYLFIDDQGKRTLTLNAGDLARRLRFGKATVVDALEESSGAMRKLA